MCRPCEKCFCHRLPQLFPPWLPCSPVRTASIWPYTNFLFNVYICINLNIHVNSELGACTRTMVFITRSSSYRRLHRPPLPSPPPLLIWTYIRRISTIISLPFKKYYRHNISIIHRHIKQYTFCHLAIIRWCVHTISININISIISISIRIIPYTRRNPPQCYN